MFRVYSLEIQMKNTLNIFYEYIHVLKCFPFFNLTFLEIFLTLLGGWAQTKGIYKIGQLGNAFIIYNVSHIT